LMHDVTRDEIRSQDPISEIQHYRKVKHPLLIDLRD